MTYTPSLVIAFCFFLQVKACQYSFNFTIDPVVVYAGETVSFVCFIQVNESTLTVTTLEKTVNASEDNEAHCGLVVGKDDRQSGVFHKERSTNCSTNGGMTSLNTLLTATTEMDKWSYRCQAVIYSGPFTRDNCTSDAIKIKVTEVPKLFLIPEDMAFNDTQMVTIICSTNSNNLVRVSISLKGNTTVNAAQRSVNMSITVSSELHNAEVLCEAPGVRQVTAQIATILVNYIVANESIVPYVNPTTNSSHTFDCANFIKSYPGAQYNWFVNSTLTNETQSSYTCKAPQWCSTNVTCVATNNVTNVKANVTFMYQKSKIEASTSVNQFSINEGDSSTIIIAVCTGGAVVIASIVAVLVWKRCICRRAVDNTSRLPCCKQKDEAIDMTCNEIYETVPMVAAAATSVRPEASLVVASSTVIGNLKHKVKSDAYLVLFSDQSSTLGDIQEKIEETVPTRNSVKNVAFLLRRANTRLVLSLSDHVHIDGNSIASDRKLRDFLKQVVERYMDTSSDELRLDLLNYPDLGTSKEEKVAKRLATLLGIPVFLSHDMYGVTTDVDDKRRVADVYFNRRHIEDPVIYTEVDLSKDSRRFPTDTQEKVVYSEIVRPARRPYLSTGQ